MRTDALISEVLGKCDVLRRAGLWPSEQTIRPRAWLRNFAPEDQTIAALLLDKFTFYNANFTNALLLASYHSIGDGMLKGPSAPAGRDLVIALSSAVFTPVRGERPNPTDSGYFLCRKARQLLRAPEASIVETPDALNHAYAGGTVIFLDDFVGSGDQFLNTWRNPDSSGRSFKLARSSTNFVPIYITLVTTDFGLDAINREAPEVAVCATHILGRTSTIFGVMEANPKLRGPIQDFLIKYSRSLRPQEAYISGNPQYLINGYKQRGLMFGFEHSIPDATLPVFWSPGNDANWEPLIERK